MLAAVLAEEVLRVHRFAALSTKGKYLQSIFGPVVWYGTVGCKLNIPFSIFRSCDDTLQNIRCEVFQGQDKCLNALIYVALRSKQPFPTSPAAQLTLLAGKTPTRNRILSSSLISSPNNRSTVRPAAAGRGRVKVVAALCPLVSFQAMSYARCRTGERPTISYSPLRKMDHTNFGLVLSRATRSR